MSATTKRPSRKRAESAVRAFLMGEVGHVPDFTMQEDGDTGWAFWILPEDTTSYVHADLSVEWLGTDHQADGADDRVVLTPLERRMLETASEFTVLQADMRTIPMSVAVRRRPQPDGTVLWGVYVGENMACNRKGEWGYEPMPSNRTERYLRSHRFPLEEAFRIADQAVKRVQAEFGRPAPRDPVDYT